MVGLIVTSGVRRLAGWIRTLATALDRLAGTIDRRPDPGMAALLARFPDAPAHWLNMLRGRFDDRAIVDRTLNAETTKPRATVAPPRVTASVRETTFAHESPPVPDAPEPVSEPRRPEAAQPRRQSSPFGAGLKPQVRRRGPEETFAELPGPVPSRRADIVFRVRPPAPAAPTPAAATRASRTRMVSEPAEGPTLRSSEVWRDPEGPSRRPDQPRLPWRAAPPHLQATPDVPGTPSRLEAPRTWLTNAVGRSAFMERPPHPASASASLTLSIEPACAPAPGRAAPEEPPIAPQRPLVRAGPAPFGPPETGVWPEFPVAPPAGIEDAAPVNRPSARLVREQEAWAWSG